MWRPRERETFQNKILVSFTVVSSRRICAAQFGLARLSCCSWHKKNAEKNHFNAGRFPTVVLKLANVTCYSDRSQTYQLNWHGPRVLPSVWVFYNEGYLICTNMHLLFFSPWTSSRVGKMWNCWTGFKMFHWALCLWEDSFTPLWFSNTKSYRLGFFCYWNISQHMYFKNYYKLQDWLLHGE